MFWVQNSDKNEPILKSRFLCDFVFGPEAPTIGNIISVSVKSISAPSINIDFERGYANQHVHYFQNGSIHWEPIQIVLHDYASINSQGQPADASRSITKHLFNYLNRNLIQQRNRTRVIDLPVFCQSIKIKKLVKFDGYDPELYFTIIYPRISKIDFGSFEYASDDINNITLTVIPEWCTNEENTTSNIPSPVATQNQTTPTSIVNQSQTTPIQSNINTDIAGAGVANADNSVQFETE
jgi:hypothetical protein